MDGTEVGAHAQAVRWQAMQAWRRVRGGTSAEAAGGEVGTAGSRGRPPWPAVHDCLRQTLLWGQGPAHVLAATARAYSGPPDYDHYFTRAVPTIPNHISLPQFQRHSGVCTGIFSRSRLC